MLLNSSAGHVKTRELKCGSQPDWATPDDDYWSVRHDSVYPAAWVDESGVGRSRGACATVTNDDQVVTCAGQGRFVDTFDHESGVGDHCPVVVARLPLAGQVVADERSLPALGRG
jgi:hypothetical protein